MGTRIRPNPCAPLWPDFWEQTTRYNFDSRRLHHLNADMAKTWVLALLCRGHRGGASASGECHTPLLPRDSRRRLRDKRILQPDEIENLIGACPDLRWRALIFIAATTGMRRGELVWLRWDGVSLEEYTVAIRSSEEHETKSGKSRVTPLIPAAVVALRALWNGRKSDE